MKHEQNMPQAALEKLIIENIDEGVMTLECNGRIFFMNPASEKLLGMAATQAIGRLYSDVFSEDSLNSRLHSAVASVLESGKTCSHKEIEFRRPDGQIIDLALSTAFLQVDVCEPDLQNIVVVLKNITDLKSLAKVRKKAVDHLSHELRTPLSIIAASLSTLEDGDANELFRTRAIERITRNLNRLKQIETAVEEILMPYDYHSISFDPSEVAGRNLENIRQAAHFRNVSLRLQSCFFCCDFLDIDIYGQAIETLVKNSIENTPDESEIFIKIHPEGEAVRLEVQDFGIGISLAELPFIFDGFHHTQDTDDYSTKTPYEFGAGGKGLELLRLKAVSEQGYFDINIDSVRCRYLPTALDHCPGCISLCPHVSSLEECKNSGGTTASILFHRESRK